jgi:hypothetical protein
VRFHLPATRAALKTRIDAGRDETPAPEPPRGVLERVMYDAPLGKNVAYVTPPGSGERRPAIVWISGGLGFGIGSSAWEEAPRNNDQSARAFRDAGLVLMRPSLRGANGNPGHHECFRGEVDDILAAADYLAKRPDVDPRRIYLGGHSTGGTMVLLVAESTDRFRAVFAFGGVATPLQYGEDGCIPAGSSDAEVVPRSPMFFMHEIVTPTFLIEGGEGGNSDVVPDLMARASPQVTSLVLADFDHFSVLAPATEVIARAIAKPDPDLRAEITAAAITAAR